MVSIAVIILGSGLNKTGKEWQNILDNPQLSNDTLTFCYHIMEHYDFNATFEGGVKRAAWHHIHPELAEVEAEALGSEFRTDLMGYLQGASTADTLTMSTLPQLKKRVEKTIQE